MSSSLPCNCLSMGSHACARELQCQSSSCCSYWKRQQLTPKGCYPLVSVMLAVPAAILFHNYPNASSSGCNEPCYQPCWTSHALQVQSSSDSPGARLCSQTSLAPFAGFSPVAGGAPASAAACCCCWCCQEAWSSSIISVGGV